MTKNTTQNSQGFFLCEKCDYKCSRKNDFKKHLDSIKHNTTKIQQKIRSCICGKVYEHRASLYNHKKSCEFVKNNNMQCIESKNETLDANMVSELIKQNKEMQSQLEVLSTKVDEISSTTIHQTNTQNNHFNINVFLNEQCKDAINFNEFIDRIEISHEDLENNAQLGFVKGISKIISDNLKNYTLYTRPIHCPDIKQDKMYIKNENNWLDEKEKVKELFNNAIQEVSRKSICTLSHWKKNNPEYNEVSSNFSNKCLTIQFESSAINNKEKYYPRVIQTIASSVPLE